MLPICRSYCRLPQTQIIRQRMHSYAERYNFNPSLYLIANRSSFQDDALFFSTIRELTKESVSFSCVQLRDHENDFETTLRTAQRLRQLLTNVPFFINTRQSFEIAKATHADGVYLERDKFSYLEARKQLGEKAIIGIPVETMKEVLDANLIEGIDYLGVKVAPSKKKPTNTDES